MRDEEELRNQVRELRRRSAALREQYRSLAHTYTELQKQWKDVCGLTVEHRNTILKEFHDTHSQPLTRASRGKSPVVSSKGGSTRQKRVQSSRHKKSKSA